VGWALAAVLVGLALGVVLVFSRPLLARLAARNIARRKVRVAIVLAGLLVGTAIIASSLVVGDTLGYIFVGDVYVRLDAIDEIVVKEFNGNLYSFPESTYTEIATGLPPHQLLGHLQEIEAALGRSPDHLPRTARTIDLDILLYGDAVMHEPDLTIPHPRMAARRFVLAQ